MAASAKQSSPVPAAKSILDVAFEALGPADGIEKVTMLPSGPKELAVVLDRAATGPALAAQLRELFVFSCFVRDSYHAQHAANAIVRVVTEALARGQQRGLFAGREARREAADLRRRTAKFLGGPVPARAAEPTSGPSLKPWQVRAQR